MAGKSFRRPAVAGSFYVSAEPGLRKQVEWCFRHEIGPGELPTVINSTNHPRKILGLISPHAGFTYSGPIAAHGFCELANDGKPDLVVIIGPNHRGWGSPIAISHSETWVTPLGEVPVDVRLARQITHAVPETKLDDVGHAMEHSVEVQIPFLQYLFADAFRILPIAILAQNPETCVQLGRAIASIIRGQNALIIASTDFSHYENHEIATKKDHMAIERILQLDTDDLFRVVREQGISMCGPGPVIAAIAACKELGANSAKLLRYATSGNISGDLGHVVGYASLTIQSAD